MILMPDAVHQRTHLSVYEITRTSYQTFRAEIEHGHWAISFVREGNVETLTRGVRDAAPSGSVIVHPPALPYAEYAEVPGTHECPVAAVVPLAEPPAFSALFGLLLRAWEAPASAARDLRVSALALQLLGLILESWQEVGSPPRPVG